MNLAPAPISSRDSTGRALAQVLAGSWRLEPEPLEVEAAHLAPLVALLIGSGSGALAWRRLRASTLASASDPASVEGAGAGLLHQAHIEQSLRARLQERKIEGLLARLHERGIEPLLIKGWASARLFPEPGLRPFGDLDLVVRPSEAEAASVALGVAVDDETQAAPFADVKTSLRPIYGMSLDEVLERAQRVDVRSQSVLLLSSEDHLRLVCLHFLRHGAWRPLWLCDIAAALEARPPGFNWGRCLGSDRRSADYVACALGLAHLLLGARVAGTPVEERARRLPAWLAPAVLRAWETPTMIQHAARPLLSGVPRRPTPLLRALRLRWPSPIEAAIEGRLPLDAHPLPGQILFYSRIYARFAQRLRPPRRFWK